MTSDANKMVASAAGLGRRSPDEFAAEINTDRPCISLDEDAFDFEPTVRAIARTIRLAPAQRGLVLHVDGEWGSGKSSALAFVKQLLREETDTAARPAFLDFSPWWFSDRDDLAKQFLQQLRLELPRENEWLMKAGALIAQYSDQLGHVVATGLGAAVGAPVPGADKVIAAGFRKLKPAEKTLPQLKLEISELLAQAKRRIAVFIDDVDRLAPNEIDQLFRVIKAVADFPNVVYVLAFDSVQVTKALESQLKVDGRPYLEKIIQVPFLLPIPTRERLRERLEARVRAIAGEDLPNDDYTDRVLRAMTFLIRRPRDLARFSNAYSCTYPVIAGEVHPVDAAALDLLRVLGLQVFWAIRDHSHDFIDAIGDEKNKRREVRSAFHETWHDGLSPKLGMDVDELVKQLFPNYVSYRRDAKFAEEAQLFASEGRVASPRGHAVYFQLRAPDGALTHRRRDELFAIDDAAVLLLEWDSLMAHGEPGKNTHAGELLQEVTLGDFSSEFAHAFVHSVLCVGDELYRNGHGRRLDHGVVTQAFVTCVRRLKDDPLGNVLRAIDAAQYLVGAIRIVHRYRKEYEHEKAFGFRLTEWLDDQAVRQMQTHALNRLLAVAERGALLKQAEAWELLGYWFHSDRDGFEPWLREVIADDSKLIDLLESFVETRLMVEGGVPGEAGFEFLPDVLPPNESMANLRERIQRIVIDGPQVLRTRALELLMHLGEHLREHAAADSAPEDEGPARGVSIDGEDAGGEEG